MKKETHEEMEEHFFQKRSKEEKLSHKRAGAKDLSKQKKTDHHKLHKEINEKKDKRLSQSKTLEGRIISICSEGIIVDVAGDLYLSILKGILKKEKTSRKSLVAVGDFVQIIPTGKTEAAITSIAPRRTILSRGDALSRRKEHIIASNIDQVLITLSVVNPPLKPPLIDRYIIASLKGGMQPFVIINKVDLLKENSLEKELLQECIEAYAKAGISLLLTSTQTGEGIQELKEAMKEKTSVFSGQSGVGKSSLINAAIGTSLKTGDVINKTKKGSHTTTSASLLPLEGGGYCIDTPGIRSFGVWDIQKESLSGYYKEMNVQCKYPDCSHTHEPGCQIVEKMGELIHPLRYANYLSILDTLDEDHLRR